MVINERLVVVFTYNGVEYDGMVNRERDIEYNCPGYWDAWLDVYVEEEWPDFWITGKTDEEGNPTTDGLLITAQDDWYDKEEHYVNEIHVSDCS